MDVESRFWQFLPGCMSSATFQLETVAPSARDAGDWDRPAFTAQNIMVTPKLWGGYYAMALCAEHAKTKPQRRGLLLPHKNLGKADADLQTLLAIQSNELG